VVARARIAEVTDAACASTIQDGPVYAESGTLTVTDVSADSAHGTFNLRFPDGETVSGAFDATSCDAAWNAYAPIQCTP
jgi:hypothetical protein